MERLKSIVQDGRMIGHGQQLAAKRLAERAAQVGPVPPSALSRPHRRWLERKGHL